MMSSAGAETDVDATETADHQDVIHGSAIKYLKFAAAIDNAPRPPLNANYRVLVAQRQRLLSSGEEESDEEDESIFYQDDEYEEPPWRAVAEIYIQDRIVEDFKLDRREVNRAPTNEAIVKSVLQDPDLSVVMAGYLDRKDLLTLPRLARWINVDYHDQVWRGLFERHWMLGRVGKASATMDIRGTTWKQQYKRRHEETSSGIGVVHEVERALEFCRGESASIEGWKDGSWKMYKDAKDMHDMTEAESNIILVNKGTLYYTDDLIDPSGEEVPPGSDVVKRSEFFFISPKGMCVISFVSLHILLTSIHIYPGYFTVREVLRIILHRYTGKNSKMAADIVGDKVFYTSGIIADGWRFY